MRLESFSEAHLQLVGELVADPDTVRWTRIPEPPPPDFLEDWLSRYEAGRRDGTKEAFAAVEDDGTPVGLALVPTIDREAGEAELGYMVAPSARGRGVATAILRELTAWAFAQGIQRCELIITAGNVASERVAGRGGYVREGLLRSVHVKQGRREDVTVWSRLPSDPEP